MQTYQQINKLPLTHTKDVNIFQEKAKVTSRMYSKPIEGPVSRKRDLVPNLFSLNLYLFYE